MRSARLYFVQWASEWNVVYVRRRVAAGAGDPCGEGLRPAGLQRRRVPLFAPTSGGFRTASPRTTCTRPPGQPAELSAARRRGARPARAEVEVRPDTSSSSGRRVLDHGLVPGEHDHLSRYNRKANTYRRTVSVEGEQRDASNGKRIAPKNVVVMLVNFSPLNDGSGKNRQEADIIGSGGRGSRRTARRSRAPGRRRASRTA